MAEQPAPPREPARADLGVYVHVPFCRHRCDYCAFATYTDRDALMGRYVDACVSDITQAVARGELERATSVFFGGGTPSRLLAAELVRILDAIPLAAAAEVTVECNPEDAAPERLAAYRAAGVTRMSFGVQSTVPHVLASLGRRHDQESVPRSLRAAVAAGFDHVNVDLIYGAVGETDEDWKRTVDTVLSLPEAPGHLSAYALTVEPGTPLARDPLRHPDDDVQATRYEAADAAFSAAGYRWEEVSNWARPGHGCRHNQLYWRQGDYLGFGSAAHSHRAGPVANRRWWNVRTPERYVAAIESGCSPVAGVETVEGESRALERLMLSLRTPDGVPATAFPETSRLEGLVVVVAGRAVLTVQGRLVANALSAMLRPPGLGADATGRGGRPGREPGQAPGRRGAPVPGNLVSS